MIKNTTLTSLPDRAGAPDLQLSEDHLSLIKTILHRLLPNGEVRVFGSRVKGRARPYSDVDLLIVQPSPLPLETRISLVDSFDESALPFTVDLLEIAQSPLSWRLEALSGSYPLQ